jgi:hypothetical protein
MIWIWRWLLLLSWLLQLLQKQTWSCPKNKTVLTTKEDEEEEEEEEEEE